MSKHAGAEAIAPLHPRPPRPFVRGGRTA